MINHKLKDNINFSFNLLYNLSKRYLYNKQPFYLNCVIKCSSFNYAKFHSIPHIRKVPINSLNFELLIYHYLHWEIRYLIGKIINFRNFPHKINVIFTYLCTLISQNYAQLSTIFNF